MTAFQTISVVGLGYIGLPTAAMFAHHGTQVIGLDVQKHAVDTINRGQIHIVEPGLEEVVNKAVSAGKLRATLTAEAADAFLIAVPTPFKGDHHDPDLSYIKSACGMIAPVLAAGTMVILESTSPVGATEQMAQWLAEMRPDLSFPQDKGDQSDIRIAHCPERVLPGNVMEELITNDRVIGGMTDLCSQQAVALYKTFVQGDCVVTNARTAEMAKLTENSFRDVNIAFANELSMICDTFDINVWELISLANRHPRVNILQPGPGVGGHCIAVDPWFIVSSAPDQAQLIRTAREVNDSKPNWVIEKVQQAIGTFLMANPEKTASDVRLGCYGIAFKPDIDDLRESPSLDIVRHLQSQHQGPILVVEDNVEALPDTLSQCQKASFEMARSTADIHILLVGHQMFLQSDAPVGVIVDANGAWT